jgi:hypothetical protein
VRSRYAFLEDEQRFVVGAVPRDASEAVQIDDRYVLGTRLRLREVRAPEGIVRKLGHKVPSGEGPSSVFHTTIYLDHHEFELLAQLPAARLAKRRWKLPGGCVADEFQGDLVGLVLVEGERPAPRPDGAVEVTDDLRFGGGALAALDTSAAAELVTVARGLLA